MAQIKIPFGEIKIRPFAWEFDKPEDGWLLTEILYTVESDQGSIKFYDEAYPVYMGEYRPMFSHLKDYLQLVKGDGLSKFYINRHPLFFNYDMTHLIELLYADIDDILDGQIGFTFMVNANREGSSQFIGGQYVIDAGLFIGFMEELEEEVREFSDRVSKWSSRS